MKVSPILMGIMYLGLGSFFTYLAVQSAGTDGEMWSFWTILLMVLATIDFVYAIRFFILKKKITQLKKKDQNKKR
ncbi:YdiK family protein [Pseudalkalibacillus hwajinpoensis]|uniref:YdiK family protein n=1 Tax=Guptibacillus hwajinpoensis TaxID=208199 RepID=UPI00325A8F27